MVSSLLYDKNIKTCSLVIACLYICSWYSNSGLFNTKLKRQGFSLTSCRCKSVGIMMNCCWDMWVRTYCCWGIWLGVHSYWVVWWGIFRGLYSYRGFHNWFSIGVWGFGWVSTGCKVCLLLYDEGFTLDRNRRRFLRIWNTAGKKDMMRDHPWHGGSSRDMAPNNY